MALTQVFSCEICEISKNTFYYRTPQVAASHFKLIYLVTQFPWMQYEYLYSCTKYFQWDLLVCLFIYPFIYLLVYLFIYLFISFFFLKNMYICNGFLLSFVFKCPPLKSIWKSSSCFAAYCNHIYILSRGVLMLLSSI